LATPPTAFIECIESAIILAEFDDPLGASIATHVDLWVLAGSKDPAATSSLSTDDALHVGTMSNISTSWSITINEATASNIRSYWKAGKEPGTLIMIFQVTDQLGNMKTDGCLMPYFKLRLEDNIVNTVNVAELETYARNNVLDRNEVHPVRVTVNVAPSESYMRNVTMYYSPVQVSASTVAAWRTAGAKALQFSLTSSVTNEWMVVLPADLPPSTVLYWAIYVEDYAGNNNSNALTVGVNKITFSAASTEDAMKEPVGYILLGVLAFGLVFAISYRTSLSVQSVKKAKKVSAAVKKAAPGKTIGGTSGKSPISKDIPTKSCPICKAKIGADLDECPYCHKKF
jgi:hypothetical protein